MGGSSRRMGADKAGLRFGGEDLRARAVSTLRKTFTEVVISDRGNQNAAAGELTVVPDLRAGKGPLAALEALLSYAEGRSVFMLACDLPLVTAGHIRQILSAAEVPGAQDTPACWIARSASGRQPLCGLYTASCLDAVQRQLDREALAMRSLLADLDVAEVELVGEGYDPLFNVNRPQDLGRLRGMAHER